ncbi:MAG: riboflavin synthase [Desulfosudaceae bacterium]
MFTGIIEGPGVIRDFAAAGSGRRLTVAAAFDLEDTGIGDSIAVNGACLTAVAVGDKWFQADVAPETLSRTTLGKMRVGRTVNLERALRLSDRLGGHLVTGHIDGTGVIRDKHSVGNAVIIRVGMDPALADYLVEKGSVAIDGISLTINDCGRDFFAVSVIPHTAGLTTIGDVRPGDVVNLETDIIGKYVRKLMFRRDGEGDKAGGQVIDREFLLKTGFL